MNFNKKIKSHLLIKTKKNLFLNTAGEHTSIFNGDGIDFKEIREYNSGDDIRHINWKVTARTKTPSVNTFNENKQLNIVIGYLNSGSIKFGSIRSKQDTMVETMAMLSVAALNKKDILSTVFFDTDELNFNISKKKQIIDQNIDMAYNLDPINNTIDYEKLEFYLLNKIKKKSIVILIGDFLDIYQFKLLSKKHELMCVVVRDKLEEDLKLTGEFDFIDMSTLNEEKIYLDDSSIKKYNKLMQEHDNTLFSSFKKYKIKYKKIYTDDNVAKQLQLLLRR